MKSDFKVTDSTGELCFSDLTQGDQIVRIPLFQREYVWSRKQFEKFVDDIAQVEDAEGDTQFLGAIVAIEQTSVPGRHRPFEIVDGQQRLTTIYLMIAAAADVLAENGHAEIAAGLISGYLLLRPIPGATTNTRIVPCTKDRQKFADMWRAIIKRTKKLRPLLSEAPAPPPASDAYKADGEGNSSKLYDMFLIAREFCEDRYQHKGAESLRGLAEIAATRLSFIFISLKDPSSAPRIFENLNNAGVRTTVANLVRNEIFSRMSDDPDRALTVFQNDWEPFQGKFGDRFDDFFFPYGLTLDSNVKKATLFEHLRKRWASLKNPADIIESLSEAGDHFLWVATDSFTPKGAPKEVTERFARLRRMKAPASTYPFLMQMGAAVLSKNTKPSEAAKTLDVVESFLVRRAICGFEPTGLHAVFKGLWKETAGDSLRVTKCIQARTTVPWPNDGSFAKEVMHGDLYRRSIAKFVLVEYERSLGADQPDNEPEIEHVMPVTLTSAWRVPSKIHEKWLNTWANLVAVSPGLNRSVKNDAYDIKRKRYLKESMFASPRDVAQQHSAWTEHELDDRAERIANWAVTRWQY